jgi:2-methylcitrate dehydratase PrpD
VQSGGRPKLAEFVASARQRAVPDSVRHVLEAAVVDSIGCGLFGLTTPAGRIVQEFAGEQGGPAEATLWVG